MREADSKRCDWWRRVNDENAHAFYFAISSRKESEPKSDGTIDHLPPSRQVSSDSQGSLKDVVRRYPRVSEIMGYALDP